MLDLEKCQKLLEKIKEESDEEFALFLKRYDAQGVAGLRSIKSSIQGRFMNEQRGLSFMNRQVCFMWLSAISMDTDILEEKKENLEFLIGILLSWRLDLE